MSLLWSESTPRYLLGTPLVIVGLLALRVRKRVGWSRALCILGVGVEAIRFAPELAVWSSLTWAVIWGQSIADHETVVRIQDTWAHSRLYILHLIAIGLIAAALLVTLWRWLRKARPKVHQVLALAGSSLLVFGMHELHDRCEDATSAELMSLPWGFSSAEWINVAEPWRIRGLDGKNIVHMTSLGGAEAEALALDAGGSLFRFEPWERDGVALGPTPLGIRSLQLVPRGGGCVSWRDAGGRCGYEFGQRPQLVATGGLSIVDIQADALFGQGNNRICALLTDRSVQCWRRYMSEPFQSEGVIAENVAAIAIDSRSLGGCLLYLDGRVDCAVKLLGNQKYFLAHVEGIEHATKIASSSDETCALETSGQLKCWRKTVDRAWIHGEGVPRFVAERVPTDVAMQDISIGGDRCAVSRIGEVYCWTYGGFDSDNAGGARMTRVPGIHDAVRVFAGATNCAAHAGGGLSCWGYQRRYGAIRKFVREKVIATHAN